MRPISDDELGWLSVLARFLVGFGPADDATLVVFADPDGGGPTSEEVRTAVLELTRRIDPGPNGGWADVQVAEASGTPGELVRLVGTVDDEMSLAQANARGLQNLGYETTPVGSGAAAVAAFEAAPHQYDVVVSDLTMPEMTGVELARRLHLVQADLPIILYTGYGDLITDESLENWGVCSVLGKPLRFSELGAAIRRCLDGPQGEG